MDEENPYSSPLAYDRQDWPVGRRTAHGVIASLERRGWVYRHFSVSFNQVRRLVEYNGRGWVESVSVDGEVVCRKRNWGATLVPTLPFEIEGDRDTHHAVIHVRGILWITAIRMLIDNELVYAEGQWKD